jgi:hypothetical protein
VECYNLRLILGKRYTTLFLHTCCVPALSVFIFAEFAASNKVSKKMATMNILKSSRPSMLRSTSVDNRHCCRHLVSFVYFILVTTGLVFFADTRQRPFYTRKRLCRVLHSAKNTRQTFYRQRVLCRVLLFRHSAKTLPSLEKHSAKKM